jgi:hypothetical protein
LRVKEKQSLGATVRLCEEPKVPVRVPFNYNYGLSMTLWL